MTIRIYTSPHCTPCQEITKLVLEGKLKGIKDEIEIIDIETDEGFERFTEEVLKNGDGQVPSAYKDGEACIIGYDEANQLGIECLPEESAEESTDDQPSSQPE